MGQTTLADVRDALRDDTHQWTIELDMAKLMGKYDYATKNLTFPYKNYLLKGELQYNDDGILEYYKTTSEIELVSENLTRISNGMAEIKLNKGGGIIGGVPGFHLVDVHVALRFFLDGLMDLREFLHVLEGVACGHYLARLHVQVVLDVVGGVVHGLDQLAHVYLQLFLPGNLDTSS